MNRFHPDNKIDLQIARSQMKTMSEHIKDLKEEIKVLEECRHSISVYVINKRRGDIDV